MFTNLAKGTTLQLTNSYFLIIPQGFGQLHRLNMLRDDEHRGGLVLLHEGQPLPGHAMAPQKWLLYGDFVMISWDFLRKNWDFLGLTSKNGDFS